MKVMANVLCSFALLLSLALALGAQEQKKPEAGKTGAAASSNVATSNLEAKVREVWQAVKNKNKNSLAAMLTDDATEVWIDGVTRDKAAVLKDVDNLTLNSYSLSDMKITPLGRDAALATYRANVQGTMKGQKFDTKLDATQVFVKRGGDWKEVRYHESEMK